MTRIARRGTASAAMLTRQPGAARSTSAAHERSVEPVAITASNSSTGRPANRAGRRTAKAHPTGRARARRGGGGGGEGAAAGAFRASPAAAYVTGQVLCVDGGMGM